MVVMDKVFYCRMMYWTAYVCATAILILSWMGLHEEKTIFISIAIACLVAAGSLSLSKGNTV
jgi:hypothetical protein